MIESHCTCGEPVLIEIGRKDVCRSDGKRPHYPESGPATTYFRCRKCSGWLADTCDAAKFGPSIHGEGEAK